MESSTRIEEAAAEWLAKRDGDTFTDADEDEFARWLNASIAHRVAFVRLDAVWQQANRLKALGAGARPGIVPPPGEWRHSPFFRQAQEPRPPTPWTSPSPLPWRGELSPSRSRGSVRTDNGGTRPWEGEARAPQEQKWVAHPYRAFAAGLVLAAAFGLGWHLWPAGPSYRTAVGGLAAVPMSDGSRITLNTDSEVRVAVTETERRVELSQGEAFFEVAKDPSRPFVVEAGDKRVVAVGTRFSVRRNGKSDDVLVVVTEGVVRLETSTTPLLARGEGRTHPWEGEGTPGHGETRLTAGTVARSNDAGTLIQEKPLAETEIMLSWRSGYLVFKDTTLADAVAEFNRYNLKKIVIEDASVAGIRIGGNFRSTNVDAFVRLLEDGFPIRVEQGDDERIVLTRI